MSKPKYDVDNEIFCYNYKKEKVKGIISMITINRKGIRYRVKVGYDNQEEVWEDDVIGIAVAKDDSESPCEDCISRQALLEAFGLSEKTRKYGGDHSGYDTLMKYEIQDILEDLPPVTPEPKMGKWIRLTDDLAQCSNCGDYIDNAIQCGYNFCPNCGVEM